MSCTKLKLHVFVYFNLFAQLVVCAFKNILSRVENDSSEQSKPHAQTYYLKQTE